MSDTTPVFVVNDCTYPLHPADNYEGAVHFRRWYGLAPDAPILMFPRWTEYARGEWRWCPRCTRRNAKRTAEAKEELACMKIEGRMFDKPMNLGGRFHSQMHQSAFANKHTPPGMAWCSWRLHYVATADLPGSKFWAGLGRCAACTAVYRHNRVAGKFKRYIQDQKPLKEEFDRLRAQCSALRLEVKSLRGLKAALESEMVAARHCPQAIYSQAAPYPSATGHAPLSPPALAT